MSPINRYSFSLSFPTTTMPKTIPQILDLGSTSSLPSVTSTEGSSRMASTSSTSLAGDPTSSKIRTSHLLQHRPKKRKRTPIIQNEDNNNNNNNDNNSLPESTRRQLEASKQILYNVIDRILDGQTLGHSLSFVYGRVEAICRYKHNEQAALADYLFNKLNTFFNKKIETPISKASVPCETEDTRELTAERFALCLCEHVLENWKIWNTIIMKLSQMFGYLEKNYLRPHHSRKSIVKYGETKFAEVYFANKSDESEIEILLAAVASGETLQTHSYARIVLDLYARVTDLYYRAKYWKPVDEGLINRSRETFKNMTTLFQRFEPKNIQLESSAQSPELIIMDQFSPRIEREYIGWFCNERFQKAFELKRRFMIIDEECAFYSSCGINKQTVDKVAAKLMFFLIFRDDFNDLVLKGFEELIDSPNEMQLLNKMCLEIEKGLVLNGKEKLVFTWKQYCEKKFQDAITTYQSNLSELQLYPNVLIYLSNVSERLELKIHFYYNDDTDFNLILKSSLEVAVNKPGNNTYIIQQMCKLCDLYFKSKLEIVVDSLDNLWELIKHPYFVLSNQVDFLTAYKKDLSRRLLLGKTSSLKEEHQLAKFFRNFGHGAEVSDSIEDMFEDLKASEEIYSKLVKNPGFEFNPVVLEKTTWSDIPSQDLSSVQLPIEFANVLKDFVQSFCKSDERNGKKQLDWSNYKLHQLTIAGHFNSGEKSISANMLQAMVILLFNESDEYTFEQLIDKTKMDAPLLQAVLNTMVTGKCKILKQQGNKIKFNNGFKDKSKAIRLPIIKESTVASVPSRGTSIDKEVVEVIERNRNEEFKSVVVRIMKQAKSLSMTNLLNQCIEILQKRRPVSVIDLKSAIERLITDEFLKRKNRDTIEYIS